MVRTTPLVLLSAGLLGLASCAGPVEPSSGVQLVVIPVFDVAVVGNPDLLRVTVFRPATQTVVAQAQGPIDPATGEATVTLQVSLESNPETFDVLLEAVRTSDNVILYSGSAAVTVASGSGTPAPVQVPVTYAGPAVAFFFVSPFDTVVTNGGTFTFVVSASDSFENQVDAPASFTLLRPADSTLLSVGRASGLARAAATGTGYVGVEVRVGGTAGPRDTAWVYVGTVPQNSVLDPAGDTFATTASSGLVPPDIVRFAGAVSGGVIVIAIDFAAPIAAPGSQAPNEVVGLIDIDSDQNALTGTFPATDTLRPNPGSTGMGADYGVDLFSLDSLGQAAVNDNALGRVVGYAPTQYQGSRLTITIPLALLKQDDGNMDLATVLGTVPEPTDIAPNTGSLRVSNLGRATMAAARPDVSGAPQVPAVRSRWGSLRDR